MMWAIWWPPAGVRVFFSSPTRLFFCEPNVVGIWGECNQRVQALSLALGYHRTERHRVIHTHRGICGDGWSGCLRVSEMDSGCSKFLASIPKADNAPLAADIKHTEAGPPGSFWPCGKNLHWFPTEGRLLLQRVPGVFLLEPSCIRILTIQCPSNSSSPIYSTITDSLPLKLVYLLAGVTDDSDSKLC